MLKEVITAIIKATLYIWQKLLDVTSLFMEIGGIMLFAIYISWSGSSNAVIARLIGYYRKTLRVWSYYCFLPAIEKAAGDIIEKDPDLHEFFHEWDEYETVRAYHRKHDEETPDSQEKLDEMVRWIGMLMPGVGAAVNVDVLEDGYKVFEASAGVLKEMAAGRISNVHRLVQELEQAYAKISESAMKHNYPASIYGVIRPTLRFDLFGLFAHIKTYTTIRRLFEQRLLEGGVVELPRKLSITVYIDDHLVDHFPLGESGRIDYELAQEVIDKYDGDEVIFELGGVA